MKYLKTIKYKILAEEEESNIYFNETVQCSLPNIEKAINKKYFENNETLG